MPELASMEKCVGCTACVLSCPQKCLQLVFDDAGFAYPQFINEELCLNCNRCEKVCPILNEKPIENECIKAYSAFSLDKKIQFDSSSGGIFTEIALSVVSSDGIVYGAAYDDAWKVVHTAVDRAEMLHELRGAKYSESILGNTFYEIECHLKNGRTVLFSGTPCQVAGLKSYLGRDYEKLICIDFVCHGIPSPMAWSKYIDARKQIDGKEEKPIRINQRSKETGWSRYSYSCIMEYSDGTCYSVLNSDDIFMKLFCNDFISRSSCKKCSFKGYERVSDITLGDFWGIWDIDSDMDNGQGTSLVLIHSEKGMKYFFDIESRIKCKEVTLEDISKENPSLLHSSSEKAERTEVLDRIKNNEFQELWDLFPKAIPTVIPIWKRVLCKLQRLISNI